MAVEILYDPKRKNACLFCNTTDWAFGPLFESTEEAEAFLEFHGDPRSLTDSEMEDAVSRFRDNVSICPECGKYCDNLDENVCGICRFTGCDKCADEHIRTGGGWPRQPALSIPRTAEGEPK